MIGINIPAPLPTDWSAERITDWIRIATEIATDAHAGQTRKVTGEPYITHPLAVAAKVEPLLRPIAILHDTVEDTKLTEHELRVRFPEWIADRVMLLSRREGESYDEFIHRLAEDAPSRKVKMADIEHNMSTLAPGSLRDKYALALRLLRLYSALGDILHTLLKNEAEPQGPASEPN